jgi:cephalosporin-C deacetylase-like acetyl esterase
MKHIIGFIKHRPSIMVWVVGLIISICYHDKLFAFINAWVIWDTIIEYYKDKAHKEYTDWLEQDRKHWHDKYLQEKLKRVTEVENIITQN